MTNRSLAQWIEALVSALRAGDPAAYRRLLGVVHAHRALIGVDDEQVTVAVRDCEIVVTPRAEAHVDGEGSTSRDAVLALLDGQVEVSAAILDGDLFIKGSEDAVMRILVAIEILLDGASRIPRLQSLGREYRGAAPVRRGPTQPSTRWYPTPRTNREDALLARLGLLPDA